MDAEDRAPGWVRRRREARTKPAPIESARAEGRREGVAQTRAALQEVLRLAETAGLPQVEAVTLYTEVGRDAALDLIRRHGSRALESHRWDQDTSNLDEVYARRARQARGE